MRTRWSCVFLILALFAAPTEATGRPSSEDVVKLESNLSFVASTTSSILVRFPHRVTDLDVRVDGAGRVHGYILRKLGPYEQEGFRPIVEDVAIGQCSEPGCKGRRPFRFRVAWNVGDEGYSGVWQLIVVADGAPVRVAFEPAREAGRTIEVTDRIDADVKTLTPRVHEERDSTIFSAGDYTSLEEADFSMMGLWTIGDTDQLTGFGACGYSGDDLQATPEVAFLPGCPTGDGHPTVLEPSPNRPGVIFTSAWLDEVKGLGGWFTTSAPPKRFGAVGLWLDF